MTGVGLCLPQLGDHVTPEGQIHRREHQGGPTC